MALEDAKLRVPGVPTERAGVFVGSSIGAFEYAAENHAIFLEKGIRRVHPLFPAQSYTGVVATQLAISLGVRGPAICISTACTSSTDAIGLALDQIQSGKLDWAIAGGTEAPLTPLLFASFDRLGIMSRENEHPARACRPFAADRDGFVLSEGAGICILEAEDVALERGARTDLALTAYSATSDGYHPLSPLPSGEEGLRALQQALIQAHLSPHDIDYVSAHAIGSKSNDPIELEILHKAFGERLPQLPVSAIKSMIGHTMGACGALALIACARAIETSTIPPTVNLKAQDLRSGIDLVPHSSRSTPVNATLSPTFGFGSRNAALILQNGS